MFSQVLECSWDELWNKVQKAQDLDHIIAAHEVFLDTIISRCLLDNNTRVTFMINGFNNTITLIAILHHTNNISIIPIFTYFSPC